MKKFIVVLAVVISFILGATIRPAGSAQAQFNGTNVRIYRQSTIIYGDNPPLQIRGEVVGFSCAAEHDPKNHTDVECFILSK
jgi:hypothetical protein